MFKSLPMPGVKLPEPPLDEQEEEGDTAEQEQLPHAVRTYSCSASSV